MFVCLLFCAGLVFFGLSEFNAIQRFIKSDAPVVDFTRKPQCLVVPTGGAHRISTAYAILDQHQVDFLIITGVHPAVKMSEIFPNFNTGNEKTDRIVLESRARSTFENAIESAPIIYSMGCKSIVLVTSDYHMRRALAIFKNYLPRTIDIQYIKVKTSEIGRNDVLLETIKSIWTRVRLMLVSGLGAGDWV